jgi:toxin CcdB
LPLAITSIAIMDNELKNFRLNITQLAAITDLHRQNNPSTPLVNLDFQTFFLNTAGITHVDKNKLSNRNYICNLRSARSSVIAGIDALITNT